MIEQPHIRPAGPDDLHGLLDLYQHLNPQDARCPPEDAIAVFQRFLHYPGSALLLAFAGPVMAASCTVVIIPNLTRGGRPYALIENVVTHADYRNRGFGTAILKAAVDLAWHERCYKAMLMTGSTKSSTLRFYQAAGFAQTKTGFQVRRPPD